MARNQPSLNDIYIVVNIPQLQVVMIILVM